MTRALFLPLALDKSLQGRTEPLPLSVAARQIPRQLAELVAGKGDLRSSYMPLVGNDGGRRGFVGFEDLVPVEQLGRIFAPMQLTPDFVVDGVLYENRVLVRLSSPETQSELEQFELPFDPDKLQGLLNHLVMEIWELFDLPGRPSTVPPMNADAFACFLAGRDEELAAQANLTRPGRESAFLPLLAALQHEPGQERVLSVVLDLARLYIEQGRGDAKEACEALARAAGFGEAPLAYLAPALRLVRQAGELSVVPAIGHLYLKAQPRDAEVALLVAAAHWSRDDVEATRDLLVTCLGEWTDEDPKGEARSGVLALLAEAHRHLDERAEQARVLEQLQRCEEWTAHAAETAARSWNEAGDYASSLRALRTALAQHPGEARLQLELGRVLLLSGESEEANEALLQARQGPPELAAEAKRLARFVEQPQILQGIETVERLLREREGKEALRVAKKLHRRHPDQAEPLYMLGLARSHLSKTRAAVRSLRRCLELDPELAEARNRLGILLVSLGRYEEAHAELLRVLEDRPHEIGPLLHISQACYYLRRFEEGRDYLSKAEELSPEHPLVRQTRETFYALQD